MNMNVEVNIITTAQLVSKVEAAVLWTVQNIIEIVNIHQKLHGILAAIKLLDTLRHTAAQTGHAHPL
jgi:hypothetical protein